MKNLILISLSILLVFSSCRKSEYESDNYRHRFDRTPRKSLLHVPDSYDGSQPVSLILAFHGGVGDPVNIEDQSQLSLLSDEEGFIVCYPEGFKRTWNAGGCCGKARDRNKDDVGMVSDLIDQLIGEYNIDPKRVYATGMSNGAFMCYRLACELSDKIAAIAPVAGSMDVPGTCSPVETVPVIHFHSYNDLAVPHLGGFGDGISDHYNPPLDSVFNVWAELNGCDATDTLIYAGADYDHWRWQNCTNDAIVEYYISHDGGHQWPMGIKPYDGSDEPSQAFNANQLMWDFFQAHPKP